MVISCLLSPVKATWKGIMLKILVTIFLVVLIPVYWKRYGYKNFLWLSDIGVFLTFFALWFESPLLMSMAMVGVFPLEAVWIIDYFYQLFTGRTLLNLAAYMFDKKYSVFLRSLSLFHIAMPIIWIGYLYKWGYVASAFYYQVVLVWIIFIVTYFFTDPLENINWVFLPKREGWKKILPIAWLVIIIVAYPIVLWPWHWLLNATLSF